MGQTADSSSDSLQKRNSPHLTVTTDGKRLCENSLDRGRERRLDSLPLPPNRTGGFSPSRSPVGGSPPRGVTQPRLGLCKREQPFLPQESIGPAVVIAATPSPATAGGWLL